MQKQKKSNLKKTTTTSKEKNITVSLPPIVNKKVFMKAYDEGRKDNRNNNNDNVDIKKFINALNHLHAESLQHKKEVKISARGQAAEYQVLTRTIENVNNIIQNKGSFAINGNSPEKGQPGEKFRQEQEKIIEMRKKLAENERMLQELQNQKVMQQTQQRSVNHYNVPTKKSVIAEMQRKQLHNLQAVNRNEVYNYQQQPRELSKAYNKPTELRAQLQNNRRGEYVPQYSNGNNQQYQHHNDSALHGVNNNAYLYKAYGHNDLSSQLKNLHYAKPQYTNAPTHNPVARPAAPNYGLYGVNNAKNDSNNMKMTFSGGVSASNMQSTYKQHFSPPKKKETSNDYTTNSRINGTRDVYDGNQGYGAGTFYNR